MSKLRTFLVRYAWRYRGWYLWGLVALLLTNALSVAIPSYLQKALASADPATGDGEYVRWVWFIFGCAFGLIFVRTASRLLIFFPGREAEFNLKNDYFNHLMKLQPTFFRTMEVGDLMSRGSNDIQFVRVLVGFAGLQILNLSFAFPLNVGMMYGISPSLTLSCVIPLILAGVVMRVAIRRMMSLYRLSQEQLASLSDDILESYNGATVVHTYGAADALLERFDQRNDAYVATQLKLAFIRSWLMPVVVVVGNFSVLILLFCGGKMVVSGDLHFGAVSAFAVYVGNLVSALFSLGWVVNVIQRGRISLTRVMAILDQEVHEQPTPTPLPEGPLGISVQNLTFTYPNSGREPALHNLNLEIAAGGTLGVFGTTGSGKTTLVRLLTGLETPPAGTLFIGGVDVTNVQLSVLRDALSVVQQNPYLFGRSVRENLVLGSTADPNDDELLSALLEQVCLDSDIDTLPAGLDTVVGERGVTLSGGQRQRVALARAFQREARVLVLDDALSAVDHDTEQRLIDTIFSGAGTRTKVIISHRVSTLRHADLILVMDGGEIIDRGSHDQLLAAGGIYADAWRSHEDNAEEPAYV